MKFEWDEEKNKQNIKDHGFGFDRAKSIFNYPYLARVDDRFDYAETRLLALGLMEGISIIAVAFSYREENIRIISARKATKQERRAYNEFTRKIY
jgi:uncharacterized DUF497 family protein